MFVGLRKIHLLCVKTFFTLISSTRSASHKIQRAFHCNPNPQSIVPKLSQGQTKKIGADFCLGKLSLLSTETSFLLKNKAEPSARGKHVRNAQSLIDKHFWVILYFVDTNFVMHLLGCLDLVKV